MQRTQGGSRPRNRRLKAGPARFARLSANESSTAELLCGCPVVTAGGERIGMVDHLMVDVLTNQVRYVVLARKRNGAIVTIPWQALYFDSALARLVFYTLC